MIRKQKDLLPLGWSSREFSLAIRSAWDTWKRVHDGPNGRDDYAAIDEWLDSSIVDTQP